MTNFVDAVQLTKRYGTFAALDSCDLSVAEGSIFGLLGPNGAGKTTLIRCMLGFIRPSSGHIHVDGINCQSESVRVRGQVAYLPAEARLFRMMRGATILEFFSQIHPGGSIVRSKNIADRLSLDLSRRVAFMSTGMRQKLAIACVLSCQAKLIVLDEPTANLDPNVRSEVLDLVRECRLRGSTVLLSSHILSEIETICDTAAILFQGQVVRSLDIAAMRATHRVWATCNDATHLKVEDIPANVQIVQQQGQRLALDITGPLHPMLAWLSNLPLTDLRIEPTGLQSIYESCCESS